MSEDIRTGVPVTPLVDVTQTRRLVPLQIGSATVYVEQVGAAVVTELDDGVRPVAPFRPQEVFENAGEILRECVRVIGDRLETIAAKTRPEEITVEFSLSFEVKGKASVIPVFVTGETGLQSGLKVTARWKRSPDGAAAQ
jgi:hypothetical protein